MKIMIFLDTLLPIISLKMEAFQNLNISNLKDLKIFKMSTIVRSKIIFEIAHTINAAPQIARCSWKFNV